MAERIKVAFPGLGIGELDISSVAIRNLFGIEGLDIRWYAIILCIGIVGAFTYFLTRGKRTEGLTEDDLLNVTIFAVPIGVVGARFLYVITSLEKYDSFSEMINIREGGLAIYGGIIFGALTILVYSKIKHHNCFKYYDAIVPGVMLGQAIGRWGNFMNGEAYGVGYNADGMPWRMTVQKFYESGKVSEVLTVHPTFLYESLWNILGFVIANLIYRKKRFDGQILCFYVAWYGFGRAWIEFLRGDSLMVCGMKLMVLLGFASCAVAIGAYIFLYKRAASGTERLDKEVAAFLSKKDNTETPDSDGNREEEN